MIRNKPMATTLLLASSLLARQVAVDESSALMEAMRTAVAGDTILVAPGTYTGSLAGSGDPGNLPNGKGYFWVGNNGTGEHPIAVVGADSAHPPVLQGSTLQEGYAVHVTGDHVVLKNLILQTGDKAVIFDNASWGLIEDCELRHSGAELLHVRDGSSHLTVHRTAIHDAGNITPNYGEGIYVGTDQARWGADDVPQTASTAPYWGPSAVSEGYGGYDWRVHHTTVSCSYLYDIAAEPMDIKEGTQYTTVTGNVFLGDSTGRKGGTSYYSYVGSFIDQKGVKGTFKDNVFWSGTNDSLVEYIAEVKRSFAHVPTDLTPAAYSKPWCDTKIAIDSNLCYAADNVVATSRPSDPRPVCADVHFNFRSPVYEGSTGVVRRRDRSIGTTPRLLLDRGLRGLQVLGRDGRWYSLTGRPAEIPPAP